jgi:hypothetical protein
VQESVKRKLSVILSADVESYRRHMGDDEEASVLSLTPYRELYHSHILFPRTDAPYIDYLSADGMAQVIYDSKGDQTTKIFDALSWLAQLANHILNKAKQTVRYYVYF